MLRLFVLISIFALLAFATPAKQSLAFTPLPPYGDGSDGPRTYSASTTDSPIDSTATGSFGTTSLSATNPAFLAGKEILIHQSQGNGAGAWEINAIQSYSAGTITTLNPLANDYFAGAQVLVLREYTNLTINAGVTVTAKAWNGSTGGIFAFLANGTTTISGNLMGVGAGFVGGARHSGISALWGRTGEGTTGPAIDSHPTPNGNGGSGGDAPPLAEEELEEGEGEMVMPEGQVLRAEAVPTVIQ